MGLWVDCTWPSTNLPHIGGYVKECICSLGTQSWMSLHALPGYPSWDHLQSWVHHLACFRKAKHTARWVRMSLADRMCGGRAIQEVLVLSRPSLLAASCTPYIGNALISRKPSRHQWLKKIRLREAAWV